MAVTQEGTPVIRMAAEGDQLSDIVAINYVNWVCSDSEPGDELELQDAAGNIVVHDYADGAYCSKTYVLKHPIDRLKVETMDKGELFIVRMPPLGFNT